MNKPDDYFLCDWYSDGPQRLGLRILRNPPRLGLPYIPIAFFPNDQEALALEVLKLLQKDNRIGNV